MTNFKVEHVSDKEKFVEETAVETVIDEYEEQLLELFLIRNPKYKFDKNYDESFARFKSEYNKPGEWFYYPWNKTLIHFLAEEEYFELRTARNKNLITQDEQLKFYHACIGVAGLSVGSHCALSIAMMGGSKHIKLADPDKISVSNLNRLRYGASALGINKAIVAARIITEMNPYAQIDLYDDGLNEGNMDDFFRGLDLCVEETDSLEIKVGAREKAKELGIPVVMATDNGDGVIVDVERYDLDPELLLFNGSLGEVSLEKLRNFDPTELPKLATKVAGPKYIVSRMKNSLLEVGRTLYSWPQLGSAATFSGVVVAYLARKIVLGDNIKTGKYDINLDSILDSAYNDDKNIQEREATTSNFLKMLGINE